MKRKPAGFTLIEMMLAVAIFAFAVVGFAVALNDVLGVNSEILRTAQRRQAIESAMALVLARSNNFVASNGWEEIPVVSEPQPWTLEQRIRQVEPFPVPGPNNTTVTVFGWWQIDLRALDDRKRPVDRIGVLLYGAR